MKDRDNAASTTILNASAPSDVTESGELERPAPAIRPRKIDCNGQPEIADRRLSRGGARRHMSAAHTDR